VLAKASFGSLLGKDKPIEDECLPPEGFQVNLTHASSWCTITSNQTEAFSADAIIFHAADYTFENTPKRKV
jgi:hypothetical protein